VAHVKRQSLGRGETARGREVAKMQQSVEEPKWGAGTRRGTSAQNFSGRHKRKKDRITYGSKRPYVKRESGISKNASGPK